jgi:phosphopantothenoylcysteine decarboxylase/phosphopantothenate--cysteine ligase
MLTGRKIIVGVTASIAAYKAALLVRELVKAGAEVRVVMTPSAAQFVTPLTLATLSRADVVSEMFPKDPGTGTWHIHLGMWADAMIIAPASANTIARLAHGFADNALTSLVLALRAPLVVAPAMDTDMYVHPATQANIEILRARGVAIVPPDEGELASGLTGPGRLPDTPVLLEAVATALAAKDLAGRRIVVSAGPTFERLDPVRYLGNFSSGKMGMALARAARRRGADVVLVAGPSAEATPPGVQRIDVTSAEEMHDAVHAAFTGADAVIMAAAVADFRPAHVAAQKIKKDAGSLDAPVLVLERTTDILASLGAVKGRRRVIGFALETENGVANAQAKLASKQADLIVLNTAGEPGSGFGATTNRITLVGAGDSVEALPLLDKLEAADRILDRLAGMFADAGTDSVRARDGQKS